VIVCLCRRVSEGDLREAVRCGARTVEELSVRCAGAGMDCGACQPWLEECLGEGNAAGASA